MNRHLNRKAFVTSLGAAGLGLAAATAGRVPSAMAQDAETEPAEPATDDMFEDFGAKRVELYNAFTAALATELGVASADEVDGAIRIAIMAVIDGEVGDDGLTAGQAEALKLLVATSDVPLPAMAFGGGPDLSITMGHGARFGPTGHMGPGFGFDETHGGARHGRIKIRNHMGDEPFQPVGDFEASEPADEESSS